ncbi:MAG: hypothetical protein ABL888_15815, partial [Pirellulaceae bacterium]
MQRFLTSSSIVGMICGQLIVLSAWGSLLAQDPDDPAALSGFGGAEAQSLIDRPTLTNGDERVFRLFYRIQKLSDQQIAAAADRTQDLHTLATRTDRFQFRVQRVRGVVDRIIKVKSPATYAEDIPHYFRSFLRGENGERAVILSLHAPSVWARAETLNEPVEFDGFLMGSLTSPDVEQPVPHFVGSHFVWRPMNDNGLGLSDGKLELAKAGFNLALLDDIERNNRLPLKIDENTAFFSLLETVSSISAQEQSASPNSTKAANLLDLIRRPQMRAGDRVALQGRVVKVIPIFASDNVDPSQKLKPQYYQVQLSVPLGKTQVTVDFDNSEQLVFRNRFPVTVVVPSRFVDAPNLKKKQIDIDGFMYRFWSYQSEFSKMNEVESGQCGPMIFATQIDVAAT